MPLRRLAAVICWALAALTWAAPPAMAFPDQARVAAGEPAALHPAIELPPAGMAVAEAAESESSTDPSAAFRTAAGPRLHGLWEFRPRAAPAMPRGRPPADLLLLLRRRNE